MINKKKIIRYLWLILLILICVLVYNKFNTKNINAFTPKYEDELSLISIFKNETFNLKTWIEHYLWQGVNKIYLIDNGSTDNPLEILQPYINKNIVIYYSLPEKYKQMEHIRYVIQKENLKKKTKWLIIGDLDEFFYSYPKKLIDTINDFNKYDVVYSNWKMFGSDGLIDHPEDIRTSIINREPELNENKKYIFKPSRVKIEDIHIHKVDNIKNQITENKKIQLNHYPIQSLQYFKEVKMSRGDVNSLKHENVRDMNYFNKYDKNTIFKDAQLSDLVNKIIN